MTTLHNAIRQQTQYKRPEIKIGFGVHKGYFIGLGDTVVESDRCNICHGKRIVENEECRSCGATGVRDKTKVAILYQMGADLIDEEWVTYLLSGPGKLRNGDPKSPTTLYVRMKNFSGGIEDEHKLDAWYEALPKLPNGRLKERIPIELVVTENNNNNLVFASVRRIEVKAKPKPDFVFKPEPVEEEAEEAEELEF